MNRLRFCLRAATKRAHFGHVKPRLTLFLSWIWFEKATVALIIDRTKHLFGGRPFFHSSWQKDEFLINGPSRKMREIGQLKGYLQKNLRNDRGQTFLINDSPRSNDKYFQFPWILLHIHEVGNCGFYIWWVGLIQGGINNNNCPSQEIISCWTVGGYLSRSVRRKKTRLWG